ncbi:MAG: tetratricopeptide repeat protein [Burkholderiaceae bacterium]
MALLLSQALWIQPLQAQTLDGIEVRRDGDDALIVLQFATDVQLLRAIQTASRDRAQISYRVVGERPRGIDAGRTTRRLGPRDGLPHMAIEDRAAADESLREVVVVARQPLELQARSGRDRKSLIVRLKGLGAGVHASHAAIAHGADTVIGSRERAGEFAIRLTTTKPGDAPVIPASLQGLKIFTRSVQRADGATLEWFAGAFPNKTQAEHVARSLRQFPDAKTVSMKDLGRTDRRAAAPTAAPARSAVPAQGAASRQSEMAPAASGAPASPESTDRLAEALYAQARQAMDEQATNDALDALDELLNLPPNKMTAPALELAGEARLAAGDTARAKIEFEAYLEAYPNGEAVERIRQRLANLDSAVAQPTRRPVARKLRERKPETTVTASTSLYYYGGNGRYRSQEFEDSPISGLPVAAGEAILTPDTSRQMIADADLRWRNRDTDRELGFVFRDSYLRDLARANRNRHRLSAAYFDYKSYANKFDLRLGRQSPRGGGVMGRFDGARLAWRGLPDWTFGVVAGLPSDDLFDTRRDFFGASVDVDGLAPGVGLGLYTIRQRIDGSTDRNAVGLEGRYLKNGFSVFAQFDYDIDFQRSNIASVQGSWLHDDGTTFNLLYDRRAPTMLSLGNSLAFLDPTNPVLPATLDDRLAGTTIAALRADVLATTPYVNQASVGVTRPFGEHWRASANLQSVETGAIPPLAHLSGFEQGRPASGRTLTTTLSVVGREPDVQTRCPRAHGEQDIGRHDQRISAVVQWLLQRWHGLADRADPAVLQRRVNRGDTTRRLTPGCASPTAAGNTSRSRAISPGSTAAIIASISMIRTAGPTNPPVAWATRSDCATTSELPTHPASNTMQEDLASLRDGIHKLDQLHERGILSETEHANARRELEQKLIANVLGQSGAAGVFRRWLAPAAMMVVVAASANLGTVAVMQNPDPAPPRLSAVRFARHRLDGLSGFVHEARAGARERRDGTTCHRLR